MKGDTMRPEDKLENLLKREYKNYDFDEVVTFRAGFWEGYRFARNMRG